MNNRVLTLIAIAAAAGIYLGYISPTWSGPIAVTRTAIASDDSALAAAASFNARETQLLTVQKGLDPAALDRLNRLLPDSVNTIGVIIDITALATRSNLTLSSVGVQADKDVPKAATTPEDATALPTGVTDPQATATVTVSAMGTYSAFKTFLTGIEKSQHLFDIKDIRFSGSETGVYTYTLTMNTYWLR